MKLTLTSFLFWIFMLSNSTMSAQLNGVENNDVIVDDVIIFEEFLALVKTQHPLAKQAELKISEGEANLLKARGGFDPKIEVDYDRKKFKGTEYYDRLNATFKIPTWYGVELKANFEENTGIFLDPSQTVPEDGLYSAGVSFSLVQGFLINQRMADLKKARYYIEQTVAERNIIINDILFRASNAYFDWAETANEAAIFSSFLINAQTRLDAIERSVEVGDKASIDITEANIILQTRKLDLEVALLKKHKARLLVSTYLWLDGVPVEIAENIEPKMPSPEILKEVLDLNENIEIDFVPDNHPKLLNLEAKINNLQVDRNLKLNKLLPKVDLQYNFLSQDYDQFNTFKTANYKAFLNISVPLFLRKERGDLQLTKLKLQDVNFEKDATQIELINKVQAIKLEINSLERQLLLVENIVSDYEKLLMAEQRIFYLGESSLFLLNSREQKLIDAQLKQNSIFTKNLNAFANLYKALGNTSNL